jgi:hypothetical protein
MPRTIPHIQTTKEKDFENVQLEESSSDESPSDSFSMAQLKDFILHLPKFEHAAWIVPFSAHLCRKQANKRSSTATATPLHRN